MTAGAPTALIADDEPLLRESLRKPVGKFRSDWQQQGDSELFGGHGSGCFRG